MSAITQENILAADPNGLVERQIKITHLTSVNNHEEYIRLANRKSCFQVILFGKDGQEKFRSYRIVSMDQLYSIIDGMPLRKEEMKHKSEDE